MYINNSGDSSTLIAPNVEETYIIDCIPPQPTSKPGASSSSDSSSDSESDKPSESDEEAVKNEEGFDLGSIIRATKNSPRVGSMSDRSTKPTPSPR